MGNLQYKPRTLDDQLVKDGLCAVGALDSDPVAKDLYFVVGGVAAQSYLPTSCRRATSDIDLAILKALNHEDFKNFSKRSAEYLQDAGYKVEMKKGQNSYHLSYFKDENEAGVIAFARRSPNNMSRIEKRLAREHDNVRKKIVEGRGITYPVSSPEDIAVPKLMRDIGYLSRNPDFAEYVNSTTGNGIGFAPLQNEDIKKILTEIEDLREEAIIHVGNPELSEKLRFVSDIFDVRILSEVIGYNENYFKESMNDWDKLREPSREKNVLFGSLLPQICI